MKKTHGLCISAQPVKNSTESAPDTNELLSSSVDKPLHYYCLSFMFGSDARGSIYIGLMEEKVTSSVIAAAKNKLKNHGANPDTAVLFSASYLGFMRPSEFDPDNWPGELLE